MSRCTTWVNASGQAQWFHGKSRDTERTSVYYLLTDGFQKRFNPPSIYSRYLIVPAFAWPLGVILMSRKPNPKIWIRIAFSLEGIAIAYAGFITFVIGYAFTRPLIGAFTGAAGVAVSAIAWLTEACISIRARLTRNRSRAV
jgi:hypothetical protein